MDSSVTTADKSGDAGAYLQSDGIEIRGRYTALALEPVPWLNIRARKVLLHRLAATNGALPVLSTVPRPATTTTMQSDGDFAGEKIKAGAKEEVQAEGSGDRRCGNDDNDIGSKGKPVKEENHDNVVIFPVAHGPSLLRRLRLRAKKRAAATAAAVAVPQLAAAAAVRRRGTASGAIDANMMQGRRQKAPAAKSLGKKDRNGSGTVGSTGIGAAASNAFAYLDPLGPVRMAGRGVSSLLRSVSGEASSSSHVSTATGATSAIVARETAQAPPTIGPGTIPGTKALKATLTPLEIDIVTSREGRERRALIEALEGALDALLAAISSSKSNARTSAAGSAETFPLDAFRRACSCMEDILEHGILVGRKQAASPSSSAIDRSASVGSDAHQLSPGSRAQQRTFCRFRSCRHDSDEHGEGRHDQGNAFGQGDSSSRSVRSESPIFRMSDASANGDSTIPPPRAEHQDRRRSGSSDAGGHAAMVAATVAAVHTEEGAVVQTLREVARRERKRVSTRTAEGATSPPHIIVDVEVEAVPSYWAFVRCIAKTKLSVNDSSAQTPKRGGGRADNTQPSAGLWIDTSPGPASPTEGMSSPAPEEELAPSYPPFSPSSSSPLPLASESSSASSEATSVISLAGLSVRDTATEGDESEFSMMMDLIRGMPLVSRGSMHSVNAGDSRDAVSLALSSNIGGGSSGGGWAAVLKKRGTSAVAIVQNERVGAHSSGGSQNNSSVPHVLVRCGFVSGLARSWLAMCLCKGLLSKHLADLLERRVAASPAPPSSSDNKKGHRTGHKRGGDRLASRFYANWSVLGDAKDSQRLLRVLRDFEKAKARAEAEAEKVAEAAAAVAREASEEEGEGGGVGKIGIARPPGIDWSDVCVAFYEPWTYGKSGFGNGTSVRDEGAANVSDNAVTMLLTRTPDSRVDFGGSDDDGGAGSKGARYVLVTPNVIEHRLT